MLFNYICICEVFLAIGYHKNIIIHYRLERIVNFVIFYLFGKLSLWNWQGSHSCGIGKDHIAVELARIT